MIYLASQIILFLLAATVLGLVVGWMLNGINAKKQADAASRRFRQKTLTLEKEHREEIDDFAQNNKRFRAEVSRLNTNNKALRENLNINNRALEIAQSEIALLSERLKTYEDLENIEDEEIPSVFTSVGNEFDKTMAIPEGQDFDSTVIEVEPEQNLSGDNPLPEEITENNTTPS
jgi:hypothetical protein